MAALAPYAIGFVLLQSGLAERIMESALSLGVSAAATGAKMAYEGAKVAYDVGSAAIHLAGDAVSYLSSGSASPAQAPSAGALSGSSTAPAAAESSASSPSDPSRVSVQHQDAKEPFALAALLGAAASTALSSLRSQSTSSSEKLSPDRVRHL